MAMNEQPENGPSRLELPAFVTHGPKGNDAKYISTLRACSLLKSESRRGSRLDEEAQMEEAEKRALEDAEEEAQRAAARERQRAAEAAEAAMLEEDEVAMLGGLPELTEEEQPVDTTVLASVPRHCSFAKMLEEHSARFLPFICSEEDISRRARILSMVSDSNRHPIPPYSPETVPQATGEANTPASHTPSVEEDTIHRAARAPPPSPATASQLTSEPEPACLDREHSGVSPPRVKQTRARALDDFARRLAAVDITGAVEAAKDPIKNEPVASAESFFLHPEPTEPTDMKDEDSWKRYLLDVEQHVKAEYWAFLEKNSDGFPGWRSKRLKELLLVPEVGDPKIYKVMNPDRPTAPDSANYHMSLVVHQGKLRILKAVRHCLPDNVLYYRLSIPGMIIDKHWPDHVDQRYDHVIFLYGYIGDRMNELAAVKTLLSADEPPSLLRSVAYPTKRQLASFKAHQPLPEASLKSSPINSGQLEVLNSLRHDIEFIQGPPGTGKKSTATRSTLGVTPTLTYLPVCPGKSTTIFHLINTFVGPAECALVSCVSNKAIDAIAEKFVHRLPFIVVGRDERIGPTARQWTLEAQVNRDAEVVQWQAAKDKLLEHGKTLELYKDDSPSRQDATASRLLEKLEGSPLEALQLCADETRRRAAAGPVFSIFFVLVDETLRLVSEELSKNKRRASLAIRRACRAVLTTIDSCGTAVARLDKRLDEDGDLVEDAETRCIADRLTLAVLDEAGTIPEAKLCVIIAVLPQITRIVSIGDQQQLEPYTDIQPRSNRNTKTEGYFHRAARVLCKEIPMLQTQFRMHPKICKLVSSISYGGKLRTDPAVAAQREREIASAQAISWIGYARKGAGESKSAGGSSSWKNDQELEIVCDRAIVEVGVLRPRNKRLLIITFYREQLYLLREKLADMGVLARDGKTGLPVDPDDGHVRVTTVDSAQGSEADCVILSMVRCNERCDVGFLANQNRAIVAISRAKDRLIIVGHKETVAAWGLWERVLNEVEGTGARGYGGGGRSGIGGGGRGGYGSGGRGGHGGVAGEAHEWVRQVPQHQLGAYLAHAQKVARPAPVALVDELAEDVSEVV
jgi:hypothetical protein